MKILLTGSTGQIGTHLAALLPRLGETMSLSRSELDLAAPDAIRGAIREARPDVIVNAAAYTEVDRAEAERELASAVNATAPGVMAEEARRLGSLLVHYSTDYVFDGAKSSAYTETDTPNPINEYGRSKLAGERAIAEAGATALVLRTSWVYDAGKRNFVTTMLRLAGERDALRVVDDQIGTPTWARAAAEATVSILRDIDHARACTGLYHLASRGSVSRFDFTERLLAMTTAERAQEPRLVRISTDDYPLPAARPLNTALDVTKLVSTFSTSTDPWDVQLAACLHERVRAKAAEAHTS